MTGNFSYLKKYISGGGNINTNCFGRVAEIEIERAEITMGRKFPSELREFYKTIGYGMLRSPHTPPSGYQFYSNNEILPPHIAVDYMLGILQHTADGRYSDYYMAESAYELLQPGDLPFFEISDSSSFMVMKLNSDNPNAVWFMGHEKIEESFERFIWNLYYDDPSYYSRGW